MEPYEHKGYLIKPNIRPATEEHAGKWVFEAATIVDPEGNEVNVAAPMHEDTRYFDSEEQAARVCISQAKALIEAGDIESED
ncbi:MAG: hypothetical protein ACOC0E_09665 [Spirochaetota bacterium]